MMRALALALLLAGAAAAQASALTINNVDLQPGTLPSGQSITVAVEVSNGGTSTVLAVSSTVQAVGSASLLSGPSPATHDITASGSAFFTWVFQAQGCGSLSFSASASGYDSGSASTATAGVVGSGQASVACTPSPTPTISPTATETPWVVYSTATPPPLVGGASIPGNLYHPEQGSLQLRFDAPYEGDISIDLYNRIGQRVKHYDLQVSPGSYTQVWDGRDEQGLMVASGIYVAQFKGKGLFKAVKFAVIK
jgi:hypothetical protein